MKELKCPFCQQELKHETTTGIYCCKSTFVDCPLGLGTGAFGTKELWQELIRTRKALGVAVDALNKCHETFTESEALIVANKHNRIANKALEQITALEQKDVK